MPETAREFFADLAARTAGGSERTRGLTASYRFDVEGAGSWRVDVDDGSVAVSESDGAADCVIAVPEDLFLRIVLRAADDAHFGPESPDGVDLVGGHESRHANDGPHALGFRRMSERATVIARRGRD